MSESWFGGGRKEREAMEEGSELCPVDDAVEGGGVHFHWLWEKDGFWTGKN